MRELRFPCRLEPANRVMLVLFAFGPLPFAAHAFARADGVVGAADARLFEGNARDWAARGAQDDAARSAYLGSAVLGVDLVRELGS